MSEKILVTRSSMSSYEEYIDAIKPLWESHWITNMGVYHKQFEKELREYFDVPEVSLMVNGHMALEMTIQSFEFPVGSEIITTPFTFISTTHAIVRNGLKPVFCDVKECDGTIDESKIEALITDSTVAIIPVHVYGNICDVEAIDRIAKKHNLKVIYDAAHAFGEKYNNVGVGNFGDASVFSFHATKVFNSIEGGAVTFSDHSIYERLYDLKNFGIHGTECVESVGANAKMNEFCAIMGLCNLKHVNDWISNRRMKAMHYTKLLDGTKGIRTLVNVNDNLERNYSYYPILIDENFPVNRDELYNILLDNDIIARKYFFPLTNNQECYKFSNFKKFENMYVAEKLSKQVLSLPFYESIEERVQNKIIDIIKGV